MSTKNPSRSALPAQAGSNLSFFERYLTLWVFLCILAGIVIGRLFPGIAVALDAMSIYQVSIPIAICLFFMMYPIMVKIDFTQAANAL
ncbi:MAG: arsenical-resistance protein, partial [Coleofasciculus sp. Co-bin14]|nr:arsenical-resistance protein [Coleofasciculus sp. Co-bin14]